MRGRSSGHADDFMREVDEAIRQDRWLKLWSHYGHYLVGAVLAVLVGTAAGVGWRAWHDNRRQAEAERYMAAVELLRQDRPAEAAEAFGALAQDADSGYAVLSRLQAAQALGEAGDTAGKLKLLDQLAADQGAGSVYRDLGELLAAQQKFGEADSDDLEGQLERLTAADNPWRYSALELVALAQLRAGDKEAARKTFASLVDDPRTPPDLSRRAAEILASLGGSPDAGPAGTAAAPGADPAQEAEATPR
ncbi:MAG TPA: tetratricopeptide repeat protein [Geminicoccaceae bacterium]|nr:tetratricopeptide repeat protein [Geminicoccaceae bacterium]